MIIMNFVFIATAPGWLSHTRTVRLVLAHPSTDLYPARNTSHVAAPIALGHLVLVNVQKRCTDKTFLNDPEKHDLRALRRAL